MGDGRWSTVTDFLLFGVCFCWILWMELGMLGLGFLTGDDLTRRYPLLPYSIFDMAFAVLAERLRDYYYFLFCFLAESEWVKERKSEDMIERYNDNITTL